MNLMSLSMAHRMLSYNHWANIRLVDNIAKVEDVDYFKQLLVPFESIHGLLQHLTYYDRKYYYKIVENILEPKIEGNLSRELLTTNVLLYSKKWLNWITELIENPKAINQSENLIEKIVDLNTHNSYHRGQINIVIAMLGYKPESLDVFLYNDSIK